jgi:hypothetical protein
MRWRGAKYVVLRHCVMPLSAMFSVGVMVLTLAPAQSATAVWEHSHGPEWWVLRGGSCDRR